jgi:hypothetical protein
MGESGVKDKILLTLEQNYKAKIAQHKLNIDIMLENPRAIPDHENFIEAIDKELVELANAHDKLQALLQYFKGPQELKEAWV